MLSYTLSLCLPAGTHFLQAGTTPEQFTKATVATITRWTYEVGVSDFDRSRARLEIYKGYQRIAEKTYLSRKWNYDEGINTGTNEVQRLSALSNERTPKQAGPLRVVRKAK